MKQTFSDLIALCQDAAGGDTSTASLTFFKQRINKNTEFVLSKLPSYFSEIERAFSTVATQQYYHYPPAMGGIESLMITVGSVDYSLDPIFSYSEWRKRNAIDIDAGAFPEKYFKRQRDFGIWPIPQAVYTGTVVYSLRGTGLTRTDYTTGTVAVTENSATVTGSGSSWSTANGVVPDMWFSLADTNGEPRGSWYRITTVGGTTSITLESVFEETTISGSNYVIGEAPELPDDMHEIIAQLSISDYFAEKRQSLTKAQAWRNVAWSGVFNESERDPRKVTGGLIDAIRRYTDRDDSQLVKRRVTRQDVYSKIRATTIS